MLPWGNKAKMTRKLVTRFGVIYSEYKKRRLLHDTGYWSVELAKILFKLCLLCLYNKEQICTYISLPTKNNLQTHFWQEGLKYHWWYSTADPEFQRLYGGLGAKRSPEQLNFICDFLLNNCSFQLVSIKLLKTFLFKKQQQ